MRKDGSADLGDPADDDADVDDDDFLREVAHVEDVPPPPPSGHAGVGEQLGHFRVLAELGRGGMGIVYLAHDEKLRRHVALKVLPPSLTQHDQRRRRFLREARAAAAVSHPNLATIYDIGEVDGRIYIAMERLEGRTLRDILATTRLSLDDALDLAGQILAGLSKAHDRRVVHRDLKPDNVMVTDDGVAKLLDFGLAKLEHGLGDEPPRPDGDTVPVDSATDHVLGTPGYMSPEQARGKPVDHRSDIFSFGVILYEMLTGTRPFKGQTHADLLTAILRDAPEPLADRTDVPATVAAVVERCLQKDPAARYDDCATIAADLGRQQAKRHTFGTPSSSTTISGAAAVLGTPTGRRVGSRARRFGVVALLAAAAAGTLVAVAPWKRYAPVQAGDECDLPEGTASAAAARPTAVTELPPPASKSPEALAAYAAAMQGFRDGNWGHVEDYLMRAVELDPGMPAAHLRLAVTQSQGNALASARESYSAAVLGRASLSARDQALLAAYEPYLGREPPSMREWVDRLRVASEKYPGDAELFGLLAYAMWDDPEAALRTAERSVELDPQYADGWQAVGKYRFRLGRMPEAMAALDKCIALSPAAADCRGERAWINSTQGRCAEMEDDFKRAVASSKRGIWDNGRAAALFALGRPRETVLEVYRHKWGQLPDKWRKLTELEDLTRLDLATGDFEAAEARLEETGRLIVSDADAGMQGGHALKRLFVFHETGRTKEAALVADDYLKRRDVFIGTPEYDNYPIYMHWAMLKGGMIGKDAFRAKRDAWVREFEGRDPHSKPVGWPLAAYGAGVETEEEALEALALYGQSLPPAAATNDMKDFIGATVGKVLALAGRDAEALPYLRSALKGCNAIDWIYPNTIIHLHLGRLLERSGDKPGACSAYGVVLRRWGDAKPRSRTADAARSRWKALACGGEGDRR